MIWNSGVLPEEWTMRDFLGKHNSRPYNPLIANAFFRSGGIEAWGRGIEKIMGACKEADAPIPKYRHIGDDFWTIFNFKKVKSEVDEVEEKRRKDSMDSTQKNTLKTVEKTVEKIILEMRRNPAITIKTLALQLGLSRRGIEEQIKQLKSKGLIRRIGPDKGGHWEVQKSEEESKPSNIIAK